MAKSNVIWSPQPGSQGLFLSCPVFELLYEGTRGPGKTDALLMDFAQFVGRGYGSGWRGILFRQSFPQLADVVTKTKKWFHRIFPEAKFNRSSHTWTWPAGEELLLRYINDPGDYWNYHGHEYPWVAFEELTNWPTIACYESMFSCCRSSDPGMPRHYRATANPYGVGHSWVKARFIDPGPPGTIIYDEKTGRKRARLHGSIYENKILLKNDPDYLLNLESLTDVNKRKAWLEGDWNIVAGGMFDDVWSESEHVLEPFNIPATWLVDRSFDWGSSHPFSVGWWAMSDGSEVRMADGTMRTFPVGTLFRIAEYYGWNGQPNKGCRLLAVEVARKIKEIEKGMPYKIVPGPADTAIFSVENGNSIADDMARAGVAWTRADKSPGSRVTGWEGMRKMFKAARVHPMEDPGLFVFSTCRHFIRTIPVLPRDERKPDDLNTNAEDHIADETRYRIMTPTFQPSKQRYWK